MTQKPSKTLWFVGFVLMSYILEGRLSPQAYAQTVRNSASRRPHARYVVRMKDMRWVAYTVAIVAPNEKIDVPEAGSGFSGNEKCASGAYQVVLHRSGSKQHKSQHIALFGEEESANVEGVFNLHEKEVYVIAGRSGKEPDLLLVMQYQSSNTDVGRIFIIQNGRLVPCMFKTPKEKPSIACELSGMTFVRLKAFTYQSSYFSNGSEQDGGGYWRQTWRFRPNERIFSLVKERRGMAL